MKKIYTCTAIAILVLFISCSSSKDFAQGYTPQSQDITYQQFYDGLSPYGSWVDYQNYGYVWVPNEQGFRPYYNNGQWVYTNYGWTWVSNYNWGWAPFHYGRWLYDDAYGWMWVPGYEWAPAWVSWRNGSDCYGWAPLGPGVNSDYGMGSIPYSYWAFVPHRYINSPRINNYYVNRNQNVTIINNTTVINNTNVTVNNTKYPAGPSAAEVEKVTNEKIMPVKIIQKNTPGNAEISGSSVSIYKPAVKETPKENDQIKPSRIVHLNELKIHQENSGSAQHETPAKEVQGNTIPADSRTQPVQDAQKVNNLPAVDEKKNPVIEKSNPVTEKQVPPPQPQKVFPDQKTPDLQGKKINGEKINDPQTQSIQSNNTGKQPPVINNQPEKVPEVTQPNKNSENIRQNISPAPVQVQPIETRKINTARTPQHTAPRANRQLSRPPVNQPPKVRIQNPVNPAEPNRSFQKEKK